MATISNIFLAQFDVFREDKQRFCWATVVEVDSNGPEMRICFRFPKTRDDHREWLDFGSPKICPYKSKVLSDVKRSDKPTPGMKQEVVAKPKTALDPSEKLNFVVGGTFCFHLNFCLVIV